MGKRNRRNHYRILHVQPDAPLEVIKASYRTLMQKLGSHPDLGGDDWNAAVINEAYRVLANPALRRDYDRQLRSLHSGLDPAGRRATSSSALHGAQQPPRGYATGRTHCLFCGSGAPTGSPGYSDTAVCVSCGSPLGRVTGRRPGNNERRAVKRVPLRDDILFYSKWPQAVPHRGQVSDLSPLGMQFLAPRPLPVHQVIKLEGRGLSAVARVTRCARAAHYREVQHLIGVRFVTMSVRKHPSPT